MESAVIMTMKFTCIGKGHGAPCLPATKEDWENLRRESWLAQMCARIEKGDEQLKHRLPVWTPHCAEFKDNHRAIADAVKPLNRLMLDFDEKGHTSDIMSQLKVESGKLKDAGIEVLLIEESVRHGTHVLVELPDGMTPETAQELMKEATGFTPDAAVKDVSRCIYMVPEDHTKYVNPKLFSIDHSPLTIEHSSVPVNEAANNGQCSMFNVQWPSEFKGIPYTSIISEWWRRNGGEPAEGERNVKLHKLAVNLRAICDNKKEVLMQVMPRFGLSDVELKSVVDSACKEEPKGISKTLSSIIDYLSLTIDHSEEDDFDGTENGQSSMVNVQWNKLPIGLKESLVGVPVSMHMPVLCGIMPIAAAYADQVTVEYCDGNTHRLGLMSIIRGEQASNKSVVKNAVDIWKRQLDEEDALSRKREEEWKERKKGRKANEKAPEDPHVLIRVVPVTVSCSKPMVLALGVQNTTSIV